MLPDNPLFNQPAYLEDKPLFSDIPPLFLNKIENFLGGKIIAAETVYGGFSPSANFVFTLADNRCFFAKGSHPAEMAHGIENLRQEINAYQTIDIISRLSPRFIGAVFDGDEDGWALGFWEYLPVNGTASIEEMVNLTLSFSQKGNVDLRLASKHNYIGSILSTDGKWQRLATDWSLQENFATLFEDDKAGDIVKTFAARQNKLPVTQYEAGLVHGDLRPDNFIKSDGRAYIIDWANACFGPLVFDRVMLHAAFRGFCGKTEEKLFTGISRDTRVSLTVLLAGYFAMQCWRPVPARLPRLRWMQKCMLGGLLADSYSLGIIESIPVMCGVRSESMT